MDKRYQVFISSTYKDLGPERQQVIQALLELDCIPAGMELFPASSEDQWTLIQRVIEACDYYLVIVGGRYGSLDSNGLSYTEKEYDYAASLNKPMIGFVHERPETISLENSEIDTELRERLERFRQKVQGKMCKFYSSPEDLGGKVSRSYIQLSRQFPAEGWVRGRFAASTETLTELNALRVENAKLKEALEQANVTPPLGASELAQGIEIHELRYQYMDEGQARRHGTLSLSWDQILGVVGPKLVVRCGESEWARYFDDQLPNLADVIPSSTRRFARFAPGEFQTVKFQFLALGYIAQSKEKQSVTDKEIYWSLTPLGKNHLTLVRAIRRTA